MWLEGIISLAVKSMFSLLPSLVCVMLKVKGEVKYVSDFLQR